MNHAYESDVGSADGDRIVTLDPYDIHLLTPMSGVEIDVVTL